MTEPSDLVDYYSRRASEYERIYRKPERQEDLATLRLWLAEQLSGHDLLEIACGTGYWTEAIAGAAGSIVATDASGETLEIARSKRYPAGRVTFRIADAYAPASVPGRFSAIFAGFFWSHVPRPRLGRFLDGLRQRLAPGGRIVLVDNLHVAGSSTPIAATDAEGNTYQERQLDDGSVHRVLKNFPDKSELTRVAAPHGHDVEVLQLTYFWCLKFTTGPQPHPSPD